MGNWVILTELGERRCTAIKIKWDSTSGIGDSGNYNFTREYGVKGSEWGTWGSGFRFDLTAHNVCDANINGGADTYYRDFIAETYQGEYNGKEYYITYDGEYVQWEWTEPVYYYGFDNKGDYDPEPIAADYIYVMLEGAEEPEIPEEPEKPNTIADNLQRIIQAKSDIKTAIENKGVTVGNITIDGYANKINQITGGEGGKTVLPNGICLSGSTWETFDTTQYDWSKVRNMRYMFNYCTNLTSLDVSNWDTSNVTAMDYMFNNCTNLTSLDVSNWDTSKVTAMNKMFTSCKNLTSLDVSNWDTSKVTNMSEIFNNCTNLISLDVSNWDTSNVTAMDYMFNYCTKLTSLDVSNWDTSNVTTMNNMFRHCSNLTSLDVSNWDTSKVTNMGEMFYRCSNLTSLDLSNWDTSNVTNMGGMFRYCSNLTEVRMGGDVSKVIDVTNMFGLITTTGTFYYNPQYDYSKIITKLPSTWQAVPME